MTKGNRTRSAHLGATTKRSRKPGKAVKEGSTEEVLVAEVQRLLSRRPSNGESPEKNAGSLGTAHNMSLPERFSKLEVSITSLSSTGDGLGLSEDGLHVYVVPFTVPGDIALAKIVTQHFDHHYTVTDFVSVTNSSPLRDNTRIKCQYFERCSGCQLQMLSYPEQLAHKRTVIERAYSHFANLTSEYIPTIGETIGSPLQYGYRTKLTPHFDRPPGSRGKSEVGFTEPPPIGFNYKNQRRVLDVEDCPIGTDAVRCGMKQERTRVAKELAKYRRGATILVRETTSRDKLLSQDNAEDMKKHENGEDSPPGTIADRQVVEIKSYTTDNNSIAVEYVGDYVFHNVAGAFFQNNNSILPKVVEYIYERILKPARPLTAPDDSTPLPITNLLDAYCGSGLFTIALSSLFRTSIGVDVSESSIRCAQKNAKLNGLENTRFIAATASKIFANLDVHPDHTAVVIDPPRKGCDNDFLTQLLEFGPRRIVYVSCNVHTQARDVGVLVEGRDTSSLRKRRYNIESIRGFDFFPQTGHVESIAVLDRTEEL